MAKKKNPPAVESAPSGPAAGGVGKIDPAKLKENVKAILALILKIAPAFMGDQPAGFAASSPEGQPQAPDPAKVEADLMSALDGATQGEGDGPEVGFAGPNLAASLKAALHGLLALADADIDAAVDIFDRVLSSKIPILAGL